MAEIIIAERTAIPKRETDFSYNCEKKLKTTAPELHRRLTDSIVSFQMMLNKYRSHFPNFTDHTILHSMEVIDFVNQIIGDNINKLNGDEVYVLLMAAYLHDSGMGITQKDYEMFLPRLNLDKAITESGEYTTEDIIRMYHHELSGMFIDKYAALFDIPSDEHIYAIKQVSRGHRKTDLMDEKEYPSALQLPNGNTVCLPYLSALIRLADELDIAADRNLAFMYDIQRITGARDIREFKKHIAIKHMSIGDDGFYMNVDASDKEVYPLVLELMDKLRQTLEECIHTAEKRTPYKIAQERITVIPEKAKENQ